MQFRWPSSAGIPARNRLFGSLWDLIRFNPAFVLLLLIVSTFLFVLPDKPDALVPPDRVVDLLGWVSRPPEMGIDDLRLQVRPLSVKLKEGELDVDGDVEVYIHSSQLKPEDYFHPPLLAGEQISVRTYLREPSYYSIPGVADRRRVAWLKGTPLRMTLKSPRQIRRIGFSGPFCLLYPFAVYLESFKRACREQLPAEVDHLVRGVFLGSKSILTEKDREKAERLGIVHLFVVSGLHVGFLAFAWARLLRFFGQPSVCLYLIPVWLYIASTGLSLPATRAGVLVSLAGLFHLVGCRWSPLNCLGLAGLIILSNHPYSLFEASFQLSFLSALAITVFALPMIRPIENINQGLRDLFSTICNTSRSRKDELRRKARFTGELWLQFLHPKLRAFVLGTTAIILSTVKMGCFSGTIQWVLLPLVLYYSNCFSWLSFLNNIILIPLFSALVITTFAFFISFWSPAAPMLSGLLSLIGLTCIQTTDWLADHLGWATFLRQPTETEIFLNFAGMLLLRWLLPTRWCALCILAPVMLLFAIENRPAPVDRLLTVTMLDVGQGECLHVMYPDGKSALIDTGGFSYGKASDFVGRRLVARYLWQERISELLFVLVTHPERDHLQGYRFLSRVFPIKKTYYFEPDPRYREPKKRISKGYSFQIGEAYNTVIHPGFDRPKKWGPNDSSLVLWLRYGAFSMLFTGDVSQTVERQILSGLQPVTVLKIAHHGSPSSTSVPFLLRMRPRIALISAGRRNHFGHPAKVVLSRIRAVGAYPFVTAKWGSLRVKTDGKRWQLLAYSIRAGQFETILGPERLTFPKASLSSDSQQ